MSLARVASAASAHPDLRASRFLNGFVLPIDMSALRGVPWRRPSDDEDVPEEEFHGSEQGGTVPVDLDEVDGHHEAYGYACQPEEQQANL